MTKVNRLLAGLVALALFAVGSVPLLASAGPTVAQSSQHETFTVEMTEQLAEVYEAKQSLTPVQRKIDCHILDVAGEIQEHISTLPEYESPRFEELSTPLLRIDTSGQIELKLTVTSLTEGQLQQLESLGMQVSVTLPEYGIVEGRLPYDQVEAVASLDFVRRVGTPSYPVYNAGQVTSAGDSLLRTDEARATFGVDGSGIQVGVMSDGVDHLWASQNSGDLPSVQVLQGGSGDEGTAMLEIIHDLAPGAPLAFYSPDTSSDMVLGIRALRDAGCKIIVDDVTFIDEPTFEDGPIAQEARAFAQGGGVYVASAGNYAQRHYMATYARSSFSLPGWEHTWGHNYGGGDMGNTLIIPPGGNVEATLQWNNAWGQAGDDFDLFLARSSDGAVLDWSIDAQNGAGDPWESIAWQNGTGSSVPVFIAVLEWSLVSSPSSLVLDYYVWADDGLEYQTSENSVNGHARVEEVLSVAAADAAAPDVIEAFSSRGPATIYFPSPETRQVPSIAGVDGVHTQTGQLGHFGDPFYGTSAAAPHVAAIAALVWQPDPMRPPSEVHSAITSTAVDLGPPGWDSTWGFGRVDAYAAVDSVVDLPEVATSDATDIDSNSAMLHGNLDELGTASAVEVSFEWGVQSGVYTNETTPQEMNSTGTFAAIIDGLSAAKTYYFRTKGVGDGTGYGSERSFTTPSPLSTQMNVGSVHFRGEIAEFYLQIASQGEPVAATTIDARLHKPDGSAETVAFQSVPDAVGLYKAELAVSPDAPIGQYLMRVEAAYESDSAISKGTSIDGFLLSETLTGWDAWLVDIRDGVATIQSDIGMMRADIASINARLTDIEGNIATIQTDIGAIRADLSDIGTKVATIEDGVAVIQTDIGIISGRVTDIEGGVATIETDVGVIQEDVSHMLDDTGTIASRTSFMLPILVIAGVGAVAGIVGLLMYRRKQE